MPRRGECIYKRKDGRWEARYVKSIDANGKKKYGSVYAKSYRAAKEKQQYFMMTPATEQKCSMSLNISDLMMRWLMHIQNRVKLSTYRKYESLIFNHILTEIGNIPISRITRLTIEVFAENRRQNGKKNGGPLSVKTVNDILMILRIAFDFAEEEYNITMPKISFLRETKKEARVLSNVEQQILIQFLVADMDIYKFGVLFALYTGVRVGELCALQWEDITDDYVQINKTMQRLRIENGKTQIIVGEPKSNSSRRIIPIPKILLPYINAFRQKQGYVLFTNRNHYAEPRIVQMRFQKMAKSCDIQNVNFHALRHTFATRCIEAGVDVKSLSEILGHSDVKTTLNRYVHSSFELKQISMEKLTFPEINI